MHLDELDVSLLCALLEDARSSHRELARRLGTSPTTVGQRIRRLEDAGLVTGATLRLDPDSLPGASRLVLGRVEAQAADAVLNRARHLPGVTEAVLTPEGRFFAVLVVQGLDAEEAVLKGLAGAGLREGSVVGVRRAVGPPPVHLFRAETGYREPCAECGRRVEEPLEEVVDGRRVVFCCPSCRRLYMERYEAFSRKAGRDPASK